METILNNCVFALPFVLIVIWLLERKEKGGKSLPVRVESEGANSEMLLLREKRSWYHNPRMMHLAGILLFAMMAAAVLSVTGVSPTSGFKPYIHGIVNFVPFQGLDHVISVSSLHGGDRYIFTNIIGNIVLFVPLGFLLPMLWSFFSKFRYTVLFGLGFSLLIECSQLFLIRATDIDDIILNTIGTAVGYGVFRLVSRFFADYLQIFREYHTKAFVPFLFVGLTYLCCVGRGAYAMYQYHQM